MSKQTWQSCRLQKLWQLGWAGRQSFGPFFASSSSSGWSGLKPGFHVFVSTIVFVLIFLFVFREIFWFLIGWSDLKHRFHEHSFALFVYFDFFLYFCLYLLKQSFGPLYDSSCIIWLIWLEIWTSFIISCWKEVILSVFFSWHK